MLNLLQDHPFEIRLRNLLITAQEHQPRGIGSGDAQQRAELLDQRSRGGPQGCWAPQLLIVHLEQLGGLPGLGQVV